MTVDRLRVGLPVSLSGRFSLQGEQVLDGIERWIRWTDDRGGVAVAGGQRLPVELVHYDDGSGSDAAADRTRQLIRDDGVEVLLGPYGSRLTRSAASVADAHEVVLWNHSGATDALYDDGSPWLVSVLAPASRYFDGLLDLVGELDRSAARVAVLWSAGGSFGDAVASGAKRRARELGFDVAMERAWTPPLDEAPSMVDALRGMDAGPDLVLAAGSFADDVRLVRALVAGGVRVKAIGAVAAGISAFGERLCGAARGVFGPSQWEPAADLVTDYGPSPAEVIDRFGAGVGRPPDYPAAQAFATGVVVEACLGVSDAYDPATGSVDQRRLRAVAGTADFTTFFGRFRIDPGTGEQTGHAPVVVQWREDGKRVVWPADRRGAEPRYPTHWHSRQ